MEYVGRQRWKPATPSTWNDGVAQFIGKRDRAFLSKQEWWKLFVIETIASFPRGTVLMRGLRSRIRDLAESQRASLLQTRRWRFGETIRLLQTAGVIRIENEVIRLIGREARKAVKRRSSRYVANYPVAAELFRTTHHMVKNLAAVRQEAGGEYRHTRKLVDRWQSGESSMTRSSASHVGQTAVRQLSEDSLKSLIGSDVLPYLRNDIKAAFRDHLEDYVDFGYHPNEAVNIVAFLNNQPKIELERLEAWKDDAAPPETPHLDASIDTLVDEMIPWR